MVNRRAIDISKVKRIMMGHESKYVYLIKQKILVRLKICIRRIRPELYNVISRMSVSI